MHDENQDMLEILLDSWDRNNTILTNLLRMVPKGDLGIRATEGSPSVGEMFSHIHYVRLILISEDAHEFARELPAEEWVAPPDASIVAELLSESAQAVRQAVEARIEMGKAMDLHYDHPILLLQHLIWHEGYHHGQIKLALKLAGREISDEEAGPGTWQVWMKKRG